MYVPMEFVSVVHVVNDQRELIMIATDLAPRLPQSD